MKELLTFDLWQRRRRRRTKAIGGRR